MRESKNIRRDNQTDLCEGWSENELGVVKEAKGKETTSDKIFITFSPKDIFLFDARNGGRVYIVSKSK